MYWYFKLDALVFIRVLGILKFYVNFQKYPGTSFRNGPKELTRQESAEGKRPVDKRRVK